MKQFAKYGDTFSEQVVISSDSCKLWNEKYKPKCIADLAVHTKKVQEVTSWLNRNLSISNRASILLLTGPTGSGKSATVNAVSDIDVNIWNDESENSSVDDFSEFLFKSSRYYDIDNDLNSVAMKRKVILIESFPNQFYIDPSPLHNLLIRYKSIGKCPLILVISDSQSMKYSPFWLIPKSLQTELSIDNISFNPIAFTQMKKAISHIMKKENKMNQFSEKQLQSIVTEICNQSNGDIRNAINNLEIIMTTSGRSLKSPESIKDNPIFIFRALGKILYCKRETDELKIKKAKEDFLACDRNSMDNFRPPLSFIPEEVFENCCLDHSTFINYLHENFLDFIEDSDQLDRIFEDFSNTDYIFNRWLPEHNNIFGQYLVSIVTRSMVFHNESRPKNSWRPMKKSQMSDLNKNISRIENEVFNNLVNIAPKLVSFHDILCPKTIFVDIVPFALKIISKNNNQNLRELGSTMKELSFSHRKVFTDIKLEDQMPIETYDFPKGVRSRVKDEEHWSVCKNVNEDNLPIENAD